MAERKPKKKMCKKNQPTTQNEDCASEVKHIQIQPNLHIYLCVLLSFHNDYSSEITVFSGL